MDPTTRLLMQGAAGAGKKLYVEDVFSTWLYTEGSSRQTITNGVDLSGKGGLVWLKARGGAFSHALYDTARGARRRLSTDGTGAQSADLTPYGVEFSSTGFTTDQGDNGVTYASWTFRKTAKFFDVVTWTGDGSDNRLISHNLGSRPGAIIAKKTSGTSHWPVWHRSLTGGGTYSTNQNAYLNLTFAAGNELCFSSNGNVDVTSTTFPVSSIAGSSGLNENGSTYVAYLFAHDAGGFGDSGNDSVSACGSFTTDGSGNATITLGWEPQWVLVKKSSTAAGNTTDDWFIYDTMRGADVSTGQKLAANTSSAESINSSFRNISATGFGWSGSASVTYIYIAIRRGPMKTPTNATTVFSASLRTGTGSVTNVTSLGFPTDLLLPKARSQAWYALYFYDRLRGSSLSLDPSSTSAESTPTAYPSAFLQNGYTLTADANGYVNYSGESYIDFNFRRAPGFFDVVAYTGTGVARTVNHNLGVAPELMIVKNRTSVDYFYVYTASTGAANALILALTNGSSGYSIWNNTAPTSTVFSLSQYNQGNANGGNFIAYLFATCPGVSKVGSYTGTGTTQQINCGFTAGARFVLIKRTDSTGDWYVWDSARGIIAGNDPYLLLNSTAAEVTSTDYVDTFSSGFEISSTAPAAINANGGSFIFLAVA